MQLPLCGLRIEKRDCEELRGLGNCLLCKETKVMDCACRKVKVHFGSEI